MTKTPASRTRSLWQRLYVPIVFLCLVLGLYISFSYTRNEVELERVVLDSSPFPCDIFKGRNDDGSRISKSVAIIGAGSAGSSAAYYIAHYTQHCPNVQITVYERNDYVGGRSTTVDAFNDPSEPVELGASIFVKVNHNLVHAVQKFGLSTQAFQSTTQDDEGEIEDTIGVYDGSKWVYRSPVDSGYKDWWMVAKLLWQYGFSPLRTNRLMKATVGSFLEMYSAPTYPFDDLSKAVHDVGLGDTMAVTGAQHLSTNGISDAFSRDIVQASTRVNYAQNLDVIHGVETMVCMATDGAMSVAGGNWQIFDSMLQHSEASVQLNTTVTNIDLDSKGSFILDREYHSQNNQSAQSPYDAVILAAPFQFSKITITPPPTRPIPEIEYINLHVTLFTSPYSLHPPAFNLDPSDTVPRTILTTLPPSTTSTYDPSQFYSISTLRRVRNPGTGRFEYLYKIFSPHPPEPEWLRYILTGQPDDEVGSPDHKEEEEVVSWKYEKIWQSYPVEKPRVTFEDIRIDIPQLGLDGESGDRSGGGGGGKGRRHLYYTSGIEGFISTMETSSLMGANVARLLVDEWIEEARMMEAAKDLGRESGERWVEEAGGKGEEGSEERMGKGGSDGEL